MQVNLNVIYDIDKNLLSLKVLLDGFSCHRGVTILSKTLKLFVVKF